MNGTFYQNSINYIWNSEIYMKFILIVKWILVVEMIWKIEYLIKKDNREVSKHWQSFETVKKLLQFLFNLWNMYKLWQQCFKFDNTNITFATGVKLLQQYSNFCNSIQKLNSNIWVKLKTYYLNKLKYFNFLEVLENIPAELIFLEVFQKRS